MVIFLVSPKSNHEIFPIIAYVFSIVHLTFTVVFFFFKSLWDENNWSYLRLYASHIYKLITVTKVTPHKIKVFISDLIHLTIFQQYSTGKWRFDPKQIATEMILTPSCREKKLNNISIFAYSESTQNNRVLAFNAIFFTFSEKKNNFSIRPFFLK